VDGDVRAHADVRSNHAISIYRYIKRLRKYLGYNSDKSRLERAVIACADTGGPLTEKKNDAEVELVVSCDCGFEARGREDELVPKVQSHGREAHNMDVTREQVLAMARPI
jgi:predicted small metal-binding protein